ALVVASGLLLGCAHSTYHAAAPTVANEGVSLSVVSGQRCFVTRDNERMPPPTNDNRVHVRVTVQIENSSPAPVGVETDKVRLTPHAAGSGTHAELAPLGPSDLTVPPGESRVLPLDFAGAGPVDCRQPFDLDPRDAVVMADRPIALAPVRLARAR
ncbi:MAG TPA: hypothetical protein VGP64_16895, partial [Polyangia bacterium]